jgi:hypothetical protein
MLWWCLEVFVVGPEACFEWLGSCRKLQAGRAVTKSKLVSALSLVFAHDDHSKTKHFKPGEEAEWIRQ